MSTNLYPFVTKNQIKAQLAADPEFRKNAIVTLFQKQTAWEQSEKATKEQNRVGFMSSHAVHGTKLAQKIIAGEDLTQEDWDKIDAIAPRYTRQLALFSREDAISSNPELSAVAKLFSSDIG